MLAHVAGIPVDEALLAAPAMLAAVTVICGYVRATARSLRHAGVPSRSGRALARDDNGQQHVVVGGFRVAREATVTGNRAG